MELSYLGKKAVNDFINTALNEDIGEGDHTSLAALESDLERKVRLIIKDEGIIAGVDLAEKIFNFMEPKIEFTRNLDDGARVKPGDIAFSASGNARKLLSHERLVLNCMQRMSGIATYTHKLQSLIAHTKAKVTDTRKTTPNFRLIEKWAVSIGGGNNHRIGLYDQILLKDNHIDYCGGVSNALTRVGNYLKETGMNLKVEIEARTIKEVSESLKFKFVDIIMLDNMSISQMLEAVKLISSQIKIEASGNITEQNIKEVAECGVDLISVGALTHSYKSLDMSLKAF